MSQSAPTTAPPPRNNLLPTKFHVPRPREGWVRRPRLEERLAAGLRAGLALVSAPAGFGKTTLVTGWLAAENRPVAWLALDERDNDPFRFLTYVVAALGQAGAALSPFLTELLAVRPTPPVETVCEVLLAELASGEAPPLVLDDYHLIREPKVNQVLELLLPCLSLILTTREDPLLPLSRLRAQGRLVELRARDLRFTTLEAADFLNQTMNLGLSGEEVAALETRTEGWAAGLQLAALSLENQDDRAGFIREFSGEDRNVVDYLVEEVLNRQSDAVRDFLLRSSVLERLNAPLCDAVVYGRTPGESARGSQALLEELEQANLFLIPLDNRREWYRYHHLFADLLRHHLRRAQPQEEPGLHRRAATWFEAEGFAMEAMSHALATGDPEMIAGVLERVAGQAAAWSSGEVNTLLGWVGGLPEEVVARRPGLCLIAVRALILTGRIDAADHFAELAGRHLPSGVPATGELAELLGVLTSYRALNVILRGDPRAGRAQLEEALALLPAGSVLSRSRAIHHLGFALEFLGESDAAVAAFLQSCEMSKSVGNRFLAAGQACDACRMLVMQGRLHQAFALAESTLSLVELNGVRLPGASLSLTMMGQVLLEWNRLEEARERLEAAVQLARRSGHLRDILNGLLELARLALGLGNLPGARALAEEAWTTATRFGNPMLTRQAGGKRARILLALGEVAPAAQWAKEYAAAPLDNMQEPEDLSVARVRLAGGDAGGALAIAKQTLAQADTGGRWGVAIDALLVTALAHRAEGAEGKATEALVRALGLAEPEGYVRLFLQEGPPLFELLRVVRGPGAAGGYAARLLAAAAPSWPGLPGGTQPAGVAERLSERELEVLALIAAGLTNQAIASRLFISLPTVKAHGRNIFGKLEANNRTEAVAKARALGLLSQ